MLRFIAVQFQRGKDTPLGENEHLPKASHISDLRVIAGRSRYDVLCKLFAQRKPIINKETRPSSPH